jgi:hypothetical protein
MDPQGSTGSSDARSGGSPCYCGSGYPSEWMLDDQGESVAKVCDDCRERVSFAYDRAACLDALDDTDDQELEDMIDMDSLQEDES